MAVLLDPSGTVWSIHRDWWPFWLVGKFIGVRWAVVIERDGQGVGRESVRRWSRSKRRMHEMALEVGAGGRGGQFTIWP